MHSAPDVAESPPSAAAKRGYNYNNDNNNDLKSQFLYMSTDSGLQSLKLSSSSNAESGQTLLGTNPMPMEKKNLLACSNSRFGVFDANHHGVPRATAQVCRTTVVTVSIN